MKEGVEKIIYINDEEEWYIEKKEKIKEIMKRKEKKKETEKGKKKIEKTRG